MRPFRISLLSAVLVLVTAHSSGAALEGGPVEPRLLLDTTGLADEVDPGEIFDTIGDVAFFYVWEFDTDGSGIPRGEDTYRRALWRTDGTPDGTFPLISPESSLYYYSEVLDGVLYFALCESDRRSTINDGRSCPLPADIHLWRTDGTLEGTFRVLGDTSRYLRFTSFVTRAVPELGLFFFATYADGVGFELWATDGTRSGTRLVTNLTMRGFGYPKDLHTAGGSLFFEVTESQEPFAAWLGRSTGTAEGTDFVRAPFEGEIDTRSFEDGGSRLFFLGQGPETMPPPFTDLFRTTLWSIGDDLDLRLLGDLGFRRRLPEPLLTAKDGRAFVRYFDGNETLSLWGSDGTEGSAELLAEAPTGTFLSLFAWLEPFDLPQGAGFLALPDDDHGIEPWITDGTKAGTTRLADLCPGECDSNPSGLGVGPGDSFLFSATDGVHGYEPWSWRPAAGTVELVGDLCPGDCSSGARWIGTLGERAYLLDTANSLDHTVWAVDPVTGAAPVPVAHLNGFNVGVFSVFFGFTSVDWIQRGESWTFWGSTTDCPLCLWSLPLQETPPPPPGPPLVSERLPGFAVKVRIGGQDGISGQSEPACIPETLCVSGALAGRSEVFVRVVGPKPNGKLWPTLVKFTTSTVEVWIEQLATGEVRYYRLEGASPGSSELPGLFDRDGFPPG